MLNGKSGFDKVVSHLLGTINTLCWNSDCKFIGGVGGVRVRQKKVIISLVLHNNSNGGYRT